MVMGKPVVLFRNDMGIHALLDRCPHRNVPLSCGKVIEGALQCPYHGWTFNAQGHCIAIPGLEFTENHPKKSIPSFATLEANQFIWICPTPSYLPQTAPYWPSLDNKQPFQQTVMTCQLKASLMNALENFLDATHTHFVHAGLVRKDKNRQTVDVQLNRQASRVDIQYKGESKQNGLISKLLEKDRQTSFGRYLYPSIGEIEYRSSNSQTLIIVMYLTPINEEELRATIVIHSPKTWVPLTIKRLFVLPFFKKALHQDIKILSTQANNINCFNEESFIFSQLDLIRPHIAKILEHQGQAPTIAINTKINI